MSIACHCQRCDAASGEPPAWAPKAWEAHADKAHCRNFRTSIRVQLDGGQSVPLGTWLKHIGMDAPGAFDRAQAPAGADAAEADSPPARPRAAARRAEPDALEELALSSLGLAPVADVQHDAKVLRHAPGSVKVLAAVLRRFEARGEPVGDAETAALLCEAFVRHCTASAELAGAGLRVLVLVTAWRALGDAALLERVAATACAAAALAGGAAAAGVAAAEGEDADGEAASPAALLAEIVAGMLESGRLADSAAAACGAVAAVWDNPGATLRLLKAMVESTQRRLESSTLVTPV